jgi:hypothetical protein
MLALRRDLTFTNGVDVNRQIRNINKKLVSSSGVLLRVYSMSQHSAD